MRPKWQKYDHRELSPGDLVVAKIKGKRRICVVGDADVFGQIGWCGCCADFDAVTHYASMGVDLSEVELPEEES